MVEQAFIETFGGLFARVLGFTVGFPCIMQFRIPYTVRVLLACTLALALAPLLFPSFSIEALLRAAVFGSWQEVYQQTSQQAGGLVVEFGLGLITGVLAGAAFWASLLSARWLTLSAFPQHRVETNFSDGSAGEGAPLEFAISLLLGSALLQAHGIELLLEPLMKSVQQNPLLALAETGARDAVVSVLSMITAAWQCAFVLAFPCIAIVVVYDLLQLLLQRLVAPFCSPHQLNACRGILVLLAVSLSVYFLEATAVEYSTRWLEELSRQGT